MAERIAGGKETLPPTSFISITYIQVAPEQMAGFMQMSRTIYMEAGVGTPGLLHKGFHVKGNEFYTVTAWKSREDMEKFRDSQNHGDAVRNVSQYGVATRFASFTGSAIPDWNEAKEILEREGGIGIEEARRRVMEDMDWFVENSREVVRKYYDEFRMGDPKFEGISFEEYYGLPFEDYMEHVVRWSYFNNFSSHLLPNYRPRVLQLGRENKDTPRREIILENNPDANLDEYNQKYLNSSIQDFYDDLDRAARLEGLSVEEINELKEDPEALGHRLLPVYIRMISFGYERQDLDLAG